MLDASTLTVLQFGADWLGPFTLLVVGAFLAAKFADIVS